MKKRLMALILALSMVLTLAACGGGGSTSSEDGGLQPSRRPALTAKRAAYCRDRTL